MKAFAATLCLLLVSGALTNHAAAQSWSSNGPLPRALESMVYDASTHRIIVFGGGSSDLTSSFTGLNDLWRLYGAPNPLGGTGLNWNQVHAVGTPPAPRSGHSAGYDPTSNRMIVFGGQLGQTTCANDVWVLTNANGFGGNAGWMELSPSGGPPPVRQEQGGVYDLGSNTLMIFGGDNCTNGAFSDVWVLSNANGVSGTPTWTQLSPAPGPQARRSFGTVYDLGSNELIIFGGYNDSGGYFNDVWVLSNANGTGGTPVWTQLSPTGNLPAVRANLSVTYDSASNHMTLFGGIAGNTIYNDTWVLTNANGMGGTTVWMQIAGSSNILPNPRAGHRAVYSPSTNVMTVFGGVLTPPPPPELVTSDVFMLSHANGQ
jgi:hypothetical protein